MSLLRDDDVSAAAFTPAAGPTDALRFRLLTPAVLGWFVAVLVYFSAVFHRTSLGVAGLRASDRFGISAGQLSVFVVLQLSVYAAMQIPTGVLVDRFGPRRLLITAALTMATAQLVFAVAPSYPTALAARALLGCGDALTFVSVLRFTAQHFSPRRFTMMVAATGTLGAIGNIVATVPLTMMLDGMGWTPSFAAASMVSLIAAAAVYVVLPRPLPAPVSGGRRTTDDWMVIGRRIGRSVSDAWATPGTRLGFWVHFTTMAFPVVFAVLWGSPYLVAVGYTERQASATLLVGVVAGVVASPIIGAVFGRHRPARVPFSIGLCLVITGLWAVLLVGFPQDPPRAFVLAVVAISAVGGPASTIGFALARDYNRPQIVGTASGVVNVGGFSAAVLMAFVIGRVLDAAGRQDPAAFRVAFAAVLAIQLAGGVQVVRWWLRTRAAALSALDRGEPIPVPVVRHRWDLAAR